VHDEHLRDKVLRTEILSSCWRKSERTPQRNCLAAMPSRWLAVVVRACILTVLHVLADADHAQHTSSVFLFFFSMTNRQHSAERIHPPFPILQCSGGSRGALGEWIPHRHTAFLVREKYAPL